MQSTSELNGRGRFYHNWFYVNLTQIRMNFHLIPFLFPHFISVPEITMEQWAMVFPSSTLKDEERDLPVTNVSFDEVIQFCNEKLVRWITALL